MKKPILIVLASRGRPEKIEEFYESWRKTTDGYSEVLTCLDDNDPLLSKYEKHRDILIDVSNNSSTCDKYNRVFKKYGNYKYYYMVGDDHRIRTSNWEKIFMDKVESSGGKGVCYGNDLMYGEKLSTAAFVSGNMLRAIGYLAIPGLIHMFVDRFWMELGKAYGKLFYFPDVVVEHMHFSVGKSPVDSVYLSVNNKRVYEHDEKIFLMWEKEQKKKDIEKIETFNGG